MPEETQPVPSNEPKTSVLDKNVPNPLAKNPNVHTHKVFASVALILIGTIVILSILAYFYRDQVADFFNENSTANMIETTKVSTSSATNSESSATTDEIADWKTYKNSEFEFKYPPNWKLTEPSQEVNLSSPDYSASTPGAEAGEPYLVVNEGTLIRFFASKVYSEGKDLRQYLDEDANGFKAYYDSGIGTISETTLGGQKAFRVDTKLGIYSPSEEFVSTSYYVANGGKFYRISRIYKSGEQSEHEETFERILSTFKFQ